MNSILPLALHLLAAFLAVATLLAALFPRRPLLGISQHWGLQLWQLGLIAVAVGLVQADWIAAALSAAVAAYWSWRLWPRKAAAEATEAQPLLRIVSANLLHKNTDFERMVESIGAIDADVIVLCETTMAARDRFRRL